MPKYDRYCSKCESTVETVERMLDSDPIPCLICDEGHMVRATWLARPSFSCERADKVSKPEPMTLPDGTEVVVKTEAQARALEKNFDGLRIHASPKENMQDAKRNRDAAQAKLKGEIKESITKTVVGMQNDGLL